MKLYAHEPHIYGREGHSDFRQWATGQIHEVTDEIGRVLLAAHPVKFCDVTNEADPQTHVCQKSLDAVEREQYLTTELTPENIVQVQPGAGRVSKQRLELRRQTYKRSRVARMNRKAASG